MGSQNPFLSCDIDFPIFGICSRCPKQKVFSFRTPPVLFKIPFYTLECGTQLLSATCSFLSWVDLIIVSHWAQSSNVVVHEPSDHITIIHNHFTSFPDFTSPNSSCGKFFVYVSFFLLNFIAHVF